MARVVVVGAGVGGLAVAARLAAKRHEVTVLERSDRVGGKLATVTHDGFSFDVGPSLLTIPAVYRDLFLRTGRPLEQEVDLRETEPGFRYRFPDGSALQLPGAGIGRTTNAIGNQFGPGSRQEWAALMHHAAEVWRLSRDDVLGTPLESDRQFAHVGRDPSAARSITPWRSLRGLSRRRLTDPRLRMVLQRYATQMGAAPGSAPSALVTIPFVEATFGLWHVGTGLGSLSDALAARARKAGATIMLNAPVGTIHHSDSAVTGVGTTSGDLFAADIVVSDVDSHWIPELLGRPVRATARRSYSAFALMLGLDGTSDGLAHHNVWFRERYGREFSALRAGRPVREPTVSVCRRDDPAMAAPGTEAWFVLVNAPRHGTGRGDTFDWSVRGAAESYADHVLEVLARRGADVRDRVLLRRIQTPLDLAARDGTRDGAIYGDAARGPGPARARNVSDIAGLYVLGGTAHPGGGLPLVGMAAEFVAERIGRAH